MDKEPIDLGHPTEPYTIFDNKDKSILFTAPAGFTGQGAIWYTNTAPNGWLICDGSTPLIKDYPRLAKLLGTTYGGNGTTTFGLPNLSGRSPVGVGTATGAAGATAHTLAQAAGEETHILSTPEMPSHNHADNGHTHGVNYHGSGAEAAGYGLTATASFQNRVGVSSGPGDTSTTGFASITNTGGGGAHNNMQPYLGVNFIIKT